jgi:hypothetical protein
MEAVYTSETSVQLPINIQCKDPRTRQALGDVCMPSSTENYLRIKVAQTAVLLIGTQKVTDSNLARDVDYSD